MAPKPKIRIVNRKGDMFEDAPPGTVLIHSCNCRGAWGKGIAAQFKKRYPEAFEEYREHCYRQQQKADLLGKCQVILPSLQSEQSQSEESTSSSDASAKHIIACLFTKVNWGAARSTKAKEEVAENTLSSMEDLLQDLSDKITNGIVTDSAELRMPQINAGAFCVPWNQTLAVLSELEVPEGAEQGPLSKIVVYTR